MGEIHDKTGCSISDISKILNSLCEIVEDKISGCDKYVELKIFPGLKITSSYISPEQSKSNLNNHNLDYILKLKATFSDSFRKKIREMHDKNK